MEQLKPCPFCGGEAKIKYGFQNQQGDRHKEMFVHCKVCNAKTKTVKQYPFQKWEDCKQMVIYLFMEQEGRQMREIIFRGKRADNGEWVYGSLITERNMFDGNLMTMHIQDIEEPYDDNLIDDKTVGQYTGMTDKNGKKVFEGDIVKVGNALVRGIFAVEYSGMGACFIVSCGESRYFLGGCSSEVIGNIHDNPELLQD